MKKQASVCRKSSVFTGFASRLAAVAAALTYAFGAVAADLTDAMPAGAEERTPAFPGAEGWGRYVSGGRGGKVIHVTNLNDAGPGSLRAAVETSGKRTVVFDVSGTIFLQKPLGINYGDITIAGQSAPGDGICIADYPLTISGSNVILRYLRLRPGNRMALEGAGEPDALEVKDTRRIMIDHCSMSWSVDECCSVYGNRFSTVQWCLISQSLRYGGHSKETHGYGAMMGGEGATYHHNLLVHHDSRHPRLGERPATGARDTTDFRCNVMYNWSGQGCYGAENMNVNIVNNYYQPGPATAGRGSGIEQRICGVGVNETPGHEMYHVWATLFVEGNHNSKYNRATLNNWSVGIWQQISATYRNNAAAYNLSEERMRLDEPVKYYYVTTHSATDAYERVLDYAGASLGRDALDALMVSDTRTGTATYTGAGEGDGPGIIDTPMDNRPADAPANWSPWPELRSGEPRTDTDGDGMPDEWELARGLDPRNPSDGNIRDELGYTMLEVYLNSLVEHITEAQLEGGSADGYTEWRREVAPEYVLAKSTLADDGSWSFEGDFTVTNDRNGGMGTSGDMVRYPADALHTISLPDELEVTGIRFTGRGHYAGERYGDARLAEVAGMAQDDSAVLPKGADGEITVDFDAPVRDELTFRFTGNAASCVITLFTRGRTSIEALEADIPDTRGAAPRGWYNLQGMAIAEPSAPGLYIHDGKLVAKGMR